MLLPLSHASIKLMAVAGLSTLDWGVLCPAPYMLLLFRAAEPLLLVLVR